MTVVDRINEVPQSLALVFGGALAGTGQATRWQALVEAALRRGHRVHVTQLATRAEQPGLPGKLAGQVASVRRIEVADEVLRSSRKALTWVPPGAAAAAAVAASMPARNESYDFVICEPVQAWSYARCLMAGVKVAGFTNDDCMRYLRYARFAATPKARTRLLAHAAQCLWYELKVIRESSFAWFVSPVERRRLQRMSAWARCLTVPNGAPEELFALPAARPGKESSVVFVGSATYEPNVQGLEWFLRDVWPRVRSATEVRLLIAGHGWQPSSSAEAGVDVLGYVPDVADLLRRAQVAVAPVLSGGGTKVKILEAMAAALPVVTTRVGAEGIPDSPGLRSARSPGQFAAEIIALLCDSDAASALGHANQSAARPFAWPAIWGHAFEAIGLR